MLILRSGYQYYFSSLDQEAYDFFISQKAKIDDKDNLFYAIEGITAPKEVINIHEYGELAVNKRIQADLENGVSLDVFVFREKDPNALELVVDDMKLLCWLSIEKDHDRECYSETELDTVINDNKILLKRYETLRKYFRYNSVTSSSNGQLLISLNKLWLTSLRRNINSISIEKILHELEHTRILLSQPGSIIGRMISMVRYGLTLSQLEYIILNHPQELKPYKKRIKDILKRFNYKDISLDLVFKKEFEILDEALCVSNNINDNNEVICYEEAKSIYLNGNFIIKDYYNRYREIDEFFSDINYITDAECAAFKETYITNFYYDVFKHLPLITTYTPYRYILDGTGVPCEMINAYHNKSAKHRQLDLVLDIKLNTVKEDMIEVYIANSKILDPLTNLPFEYDNATKKLNFPSGPNPFLRKYSGVTLYDI